MITLYTWPTPNGQKIQIMLEEIGLPYELKLVNILKGEQFKPDFLLINPNGKIPAIVDQAADGGPLSIFESGAILLYLAEKSGQFISADQKGRTATLEWLFFQCSGLGPMLGQASHFRTYVKEDIPYAVQRYTNEANRLYGVLETRLVESPWLGGEAYSIADMAAFPWVCRNRRQGVSIDAFPAVKAWRERISARAAVTRAMALGKEPARASTLDADARVVLFGGGSETREAAR